MKFGHNLPRNQVPEWASSYINYKGLKQLIKNATACPTHSGEPDLAGFFHSLDRNLEDVDHFYNKKYQDFCRRLKILEDRYGATLEASQELQSEEREDLLAALLELRSELRKLQWYGEVNRRGFIKITKKMDKNVPNANAQRKFLSLKVDPAPFATNTELFATMSKLNDWISLLSEAATTAVPGDKLSIPGLSLKHSTSRQKLRIADESFVEVEQQIQKDRAADLVKKLAGVKTSLSDIPETVYQQFLKGLLQRAITARSRSCTVALLEQVVFLDDQEDIYKRNCLHRLIITIGRQHSDSDTKPNDELRLNAEAELYNFIVPAVNPSKPFKVNVAQEEKHQTSLTRADERVAFLQFLLDNLQPTQHSALLARDVSGRTPLHYAAEYGVRVMCQIIIEHLQRWKLFNVDQGIDGPEWQDSEGWAPLHLSAIGGHPLTTQALLDSETGSSIEQPSQRVQRRSSRTAAVLAIATKANFIEVVRILVQAGVDINYQDEHGETALHVAARFGRADCARLLLTGTKSQKADTELAENAYGWTPLFVACVDGHQPIVELLIDADANLERKDTSGWTAKEHAALRGNIAIADRLAEVTLEPESHSSSSTASSSPRTSTSLIDRKSNGTNTPAVKVGETLKTFGHRYLTDKSMVLVSLGTMNMRNPKPPVSLDRIPLNNAHSTQLDTALSVVISAKGAEGEPEIIDLPVQENISTESMVFHATDPMQVKLIFDLVPTYAGNHERIVGRAVALLGSLRPNLGSNRKIQLQGDITVPIIAATDLEVIGSLTFNYLVITPFSHPNMSVNEDQTYWKSMASTMVIGHRGLGKNVAGRQSLQLGENTVQSFIAAANLGASYVEFDIQLTKDHVPVIYHDFLVSETGIDAPVHTLTLEQFLHVNDMRNYRHSRSTSPKKYYSKPQDVHNDDPRLKPRVRAISLGGAISDTSEMDERMKHTRDFKKKGFKGNSRGNHIQAPFATLEELFKKLPTSVGFNMEMKYPMLSESEDEDMDRYAVEINSFVDTILTKVYELGTGRNMIFSSFNPDICLLLSFKQPSIPVLFLTDAGMSEVGDIRATSLQEAVRFASRWNLLGVVSAAQPFVLAPRLVRVVKESGLVCVSYGTQNNDSENVKRQVQQGIDAVIVDSVLAIRRGLTGGYTGKQADGALNELENLAKGQPDSSSESLLLPKFAEPEEITTDERHETNGVHTSPLEEVTRTLQAV